MDLIDLINTYVPAKFIPFVLGVWALLFYIACPLIKKFASPGTWLVKAAEWITQDSHRPPPVDSAKTAAAKPAGS